MTAYRLDQHPTGCRDGIFLDRNGAMINTRISASRILVAGFDSRE